MNSAARDLIVKDGRIEIRRFDTQRIRPSHRHDGSVRTEEFELRKHSKQVEEEELEEEFDDEAG